MSNAKAQKLIRAAKAKYGADSYLGKQEFCPKCNKMVNPIRGQVPKCTECGEPTNPVT